jgi:hypothetical protein
MIRGKGSGSSSITNNMGASVPLLTHAGISVKFSMICFGVIGKKWRFTSSAG